MNAEIDAQEVRERVQRIAANTGVPPELVFLEIANGLPEPRRSELLEAIARRGDA